MFKTRFISMLVLLAAVVTGARAQWTGETYTATATENLGAITVNADATLTINEGVTVTVTGGINVASGTLTVTGPGTLVVTGAKGNDGSDNYDGNGGAGGNGGVAISGNIIVQGGATVTATGGNGGKGGFGYVNGGNGGNGGNAFAGTLTYKSGTVTANGGSGGSGGMGENEDDGSSGSAGKAFANDVDFSETTGYSVTNGTSTITTISNQRTVVISGGTPIPTGYSVSLKEGTDDATSWQGKAGEGNYQDLPLTGLEAGTAVSVKYDGTKKVKSVKAKKKAAAAAPAATVTTAPTAKTGVKAGQNEAIVNAGTAEGGTMMYMVNATQPASTDGFSATVPTAEGLTAGTYYVWYYAKGDASHTDSEISATGIEVTIAAAGPALNLTSPAVGQVIGDDGKNYDYASLPDGVTAVAKICYVNGSHGLALALADEAESSTMVWQDAIDACAAHTPAITGGTWKLASLDEWNNMITAAGSHTDLRDGFSSVGGTNMQLDCYWSSSEVDSESAWLYYFGNGQGYSIDDYKDSGYFVRACLAW